MRKLNFLLFWVFLLATQGCSILEEEASPYEHSYTYRYTVSTDITYGGADFSKPEEGAGAYGLTYDEDFSINGSQLSHSSSYSNSNGIEFPGKIEELEFLFINEKNREFPHTFHLEEIPAITFPVISDPISSDEAWDITWTGDPLEAGEEMQVIILESDYYDIENEPGSVKITISATEMNYYSYDDISVSLTRIKTLPLYSELEGTIRYEYSTGFNNVEVE
ncbi:MAG: hypothetical protein H7X71_02315 [Chitinophagales bacterium]|nr:hypothetical protein [Chitinophagales bacterium]